MNHAATFCSERTFALQLHVQASAPQALSGALEHVMSGRCHVFASGAELLACLALEQARPLPDDARALPPLTQSLIQPRQPTRNHP